MPKLRLESSPPDGHFEIVGGGGMAGGEKGEESENDLSLRFLLLLFEPLETH